MRSRFFQASRKVSKKHRAQRAKSARQRLFRPVTLEPLEDRRLLAGVDDGNDGLQPVYPGEGAGGWKLPYEPDRILVQLKPGITTAQAAQLYQRENVKVLKSFDMLGAALIDLPGYTVDVEGTVERWKKLPEVAVAEPNYYRHLTQRFPNDPLFSQMWGLHNVGQNGGTTDADIDAPEAWEIFTGSQQVVVAIVDTGIEYNHPDLVANMWRNPGEIPGDGIDNDNNGYIDDIFGIDTAERDVDPLDFHGHGTHVAGTVGARGNNSVGVVGVNWNVQLMAVKIFDDAGAGATAATVIEGVNYITRMKTQHGINLRVSNNSYGGGPPSVLEEQAVAASINAGVLFVAAAGNGGADGIGDNNDVLPQFPASYPLEGIISVAASDLNDQLGGFSNFGASSVDLAAPGVSVLSTALATGPVSGPTLYTAISGTSMASPHVAGAAALLSGLAPTFGVLELKQAILATVDPIPAFANRLVTGGRLNLLRMLESAKQFQINGRVWQDENANDRLDSPVEQGVGGWTVFIDLNNNGSLDGNEPSTVTLADGSYTLLSFGGPGTYTVAQVLQPLWEQTFPDSGTHQVTIRTREDIVRGVNFGVRPVRGAVSGVKWHDVNGDGVRDANEPGVPGVFIYVDFDENNRVGIGEPAAKTGADGRYLITNVPPGSRLVREILDPGWEQIYPLNDTGSMAHRVTVLPAETTPNVDFGNRVALDFGDAPAPYPTQAEDGGAVHGWLAGFGLGTRVDVESDGRPSTGANGDDSNGSDDEDGVTFTSTIFAGRTATVDVVAMFGSNPRGLLQAWIDFNRDGDWQDAGEQIFKDLDLREGTNSLTFTVPADAVLGQTYARFRYGYERGIAATGRARAGEVEDYQVLVLGNVPIASDDSFIVDQNSVENTLDVLANDFPSANGPLRIVAVATPSDGGQVTISGNGTSLRYTPPPNFIGIETFNYTIEDAAGARATAQVTVRVEPVFNAAIAVDDSFDVNENSSLNVFNVLANDIVGRNGPVTITVVGTPSNGTAVVDRRNTPDPSDDVIRYTPLPGFGGTDQFTYTIEDAANNTSTATVTVHVLPGDRADDQVQLRLDVTDAAGTPLETVAIGQQFELRVFVRDLRQGVSDPGVFAAYLDVLYDSDLVSVVRTRNSPFFQITYGPEYGQGKSGDASIPGLIDEVGAFQTGTSPLGNGEFLLFRITMMANQQGVAEFIGDPADESPSHDVLLFQPPEEVPIPRVRYLRDSVQVIGTGAPPVAVEDTFIVSAGVSNRLDVLANDSDPSNQKLRIINVTQPVNGTASIDDNGTPNDPTDDAVRYTPNSSFTGSEQFSYTIRNESGLVDSAVITVQVSTGSQLDDTVRFRIETTDLTGAPLAVVQKGQKFQLRGYVSDIRAAGQDRGVFAAYMDLLYEQDLVSLVSSSNRFGFEVQFGPEYRNGTNASAPVPGLVDEIGAFQSGTSPLGSGEFLLYTITFMAGAAGVADFRTDPADQSPAHDTLLFDPPSPVTFEQIHFGATSITITETGTFTNGRNPLDVNRDGYVSPIDALFVINDINRYGARSLSSGVVPEGETRSANIFPDVNSDGYITSIDALQIVNFLNRRSQAEAESAEAEGESDGRSTLVASVAPVLSNPVPGVLSQPSSSFNSRSETTTSVSASATPQKAIDEAILYFSAEQDAKLSTRTSSSLSDAEDEKDEQDQWLDDLAADISAAWDRDPLSESL